MKIKNKVLLLICLVAVMLIHGQTVSNAALQANGKSTKTDTIENWVLNIRKMEATGGTLGLQDTINTTNLTSTASESNNLDIHMELNTEYGAMAILSASSYGNPNKIANGGTTTGNKTGVYINLNSEWVSAGIENMQSSQLKNANAKYRNIYAQNYVAKRGDAIGETAGWHGGTKKWNIGKVLSVIRSVDSIFSYDTSYVSQKCVTRAVIVVGERTLIKKLCKFEKVKSLKSIGGKIYEKNTLK